MHAIRDARGNVLFPGRVVLEEALARDEDFVHQVSTLLLALDEDALAAAGPKEVDEMIRDRMATIDVLETAAAELVTPESGEEALR